MIRYISSCTHSVQTCCNYLQMVMPKFPVIVKIGHAYAGMGKVRRIIYVYVCVVI